MNRRINTILPAVCFVLGSCEPLLGQAVSKNVAAGAATANAQTAARSAGTASIQTMPASDALRRTPPRPVIRPPSWRDVEQRLESLNKQRTQWGSGFEIVAEFYEELARPSTTGAKTMEEHLKHLEQWRTEIPESVAARVVAANALTDFAWEARGSGWAATVTEQGWKLFRERIREAHRLLDEAIELGVKDGEAYARLMVIAYAEGQPREQADAWLAAGMKLDPTYYSMYSNMAVYLMPRWMGEPGDIERFAADVARKLPGDNGLQAFGWIAFTIQRYECGWGETLFRGDYDRQMLVRAAEVMLKRFPRSSRIAHFAALCSLVALDHQAAMRIRPYLREYNEEDKVWAWENSLKHFHDWSGAAEHPRGEESWVFAGLTGCPGIAFGNDAQHVWVAQQFGGSAVNLMKVRTGKIELPLPSPGGVINGFAYDPGRQWAVFSAWDGPLTGWMLLDLSRSSKPVVHATKEKCDTLAFHPTRPMVYWSEGKTVRSWDIVTDAAGPEIELNEHVHWLNLSSDGSVLAANHWICDAATGKVKHQLGPKPGQPPKLHVRNIVSIDDEGRPWATVASAVPNDTKPSLVRFSADGETWETLLDGIGSQMAWLSPDRKLLATVGLPKNGAAVSRIDVWNIAARKRVKQFEGHWNSVQEVAFSPDGSKLASVARWADAVKIWPLEGLAD